MADERNNDGRGSPHAKRRKKNLPDDMRGMDAMDRIVNVNETSGKISNSHKFDGLDAMDQIIIDTSVKLTVEAPTNTIEDSDQTGTSNEDEDSEELTVAAPTNTIEDSDQIGTSNEDESLVDSNEERLKEYQRRRRQFEKITVVAPTNEIEDSNQSGPSYGDEDSDELCTRIVSVNLVRHVLMKKLAVLIFI